MIKWLFRITLGVVFLVFGGMKLIDIPLFLEAVRQYGILSEVVGRLYALALPWVEVVIGVLLLIGLWLRWMVPVVILIIASFISATVFNLFWLHVAFNSCGCLGALDWPLNWSHLVVQVVMLAMAGYLLFGRGDALSLDIALPIGDIKLSDYSVCFS